MPLLNRDLGRKQSHLLRDYDSTTKVTCQVTKLKISRENFDKDVAKYVTVCYTLLIMWQKIFFF